MEAESLPPGQARNETGVVHRRSGGKRRIVVFLTVSLACVALLALLGYQILEPDFTLAALSSRPAPSVHLASLKGKPVMLDFWASWCVPCQHEAPLLQATWQRVQSQAIIFLGIDFQDDHSEGLNFFRTYAITYLNVV